jgi:putative FmdB family regulatory protein
MPTYEYVCQKCGQEFDVSQSIKDRALTRCPTKACGGRVRRKLGVGAGIIFKGSGFYTTDYRSDSYRTAAKADSAPTAAKAASGEADSTTPSPKKEASTTARPSAEKPPPKTAAKAS